MNPGSQSGLSAGKRRVILAVLLSGTFMLLLDSTIVNVALPSIVDDIGADYAAIQWVVSGYALAFGLLLLPSGWLGDRIGHKRVLAGGMVGFTVASVWCGLSEGAGELIAWRVVQGGTAAAINPSILAMLRLLYHGQARARAFAVYGAVAGAATALGPLLGGLLVEWDIAGLSWRPIFLVNVPVGVLAVAAVTWLAPRTGTGGGRLDVVGLLLIVSALFTLTFPLTEGRDIAWPGWIFAMLAASALLFGLFAWWQLRRIRRGANPLLDVRMFANRSFAAGIGVSVTFFSCFVSLMFALSLYLQTGLGNSPLLAGAIIMPFALGTATGSIVGNTVLAPRIGRTVLHYGATLVAAGIAGLMVVLSPQYAPAAGWLLIAPLFMAGIGAGMIIGPNVNIVMSGVDSHVAGVASGALSTAQRIGPALGIAVIGIVLFGSLASGADDVARQQQDQLSQRLSQSQTADTAHVEEEFGACVRAMAQQQDPSRTPPQCQFVQGLDSADRHIVEAGIVHAQQVNYSQATQNACWFSLTAIAITWLLVFALPKPAARSGTPRSS